MIRREATWKVNACVYWGKEFVDWMPLSLCTFTYNIILCVLARAFIKVSRARLEWIIGQEDTQNSATGFISLEPKLSISHVSWCACVETWPEKPPRVCFYWVQFSRSREEKKGAAHSVPHPEMEIAEFDWESGVHASRRLPKECCFIR
jgi:hypothetical protein